MTDPNNTFFFSDPHFDHTNIIRYCNRPFKDVEEMNETLLRNYREVVKPDSVVYFLGDMAFGRESRPPSWWLSQLHGNITYIKGSHDDGMPGYGQLILDTGIGEVLLIHRPYDAPGDWRGWIIHGHTHSNQMVNDHYRKVCVCVEATDYRPVSLQQIRDSIKFLSGCTCKANLAVV